MGWVGSCLHERELRRQAERKRGAEGRMAGLHRGGKRERSQCSQTGEVCLGGLRSYPQQHTDAGSQTMHADGSRDRRPGQCVLAAQSLTSQEPSQTCPCPWPQLPESSWHWGRPQPHRGLHHPTHTAASPARPSLGPTPLPPSWDQGRSCWDRSSSCVLLLQSQGTRGCQAGSPWACMEGKAGPLQRRGR